MLRWLHGGDLELNLGKVQIAGQIEEVRALGKGGRCQGRLRWEEPPRTWSKSICLICMLGSIGVVSAPMLWAWGEGAEMPGRTEGVGASVELEFAHLDLCVENELEASPVVDAPLNPNPNPHPDAEPCPSPHS